MSYDQSSSWSKLGDEGKGKITDMLAEKADIIVDFRVVQMQDIPL